MEFLGASSLGKKSAGATFSGELFGVAFGPKFSPKCFVENVSYKGLLAEARPFPDFRGHEIRPLGLPMLLTPHTNLLLRSNSPPKAEFKTTGFKGKL